MRPPFEVFGSAYGRAWENRQRQMTWLDVADVTVEGHGRMRSTRERSVYFRSVVALRSRARSLSRRPEANCTIALENHRRSPSPGYMQDCAKCRVAGKLTVIIQVNFPQKFRIPRQCASPIIVGGSFLGFVQWNGVGVGARLPRRRLPRRRPSAGSAHLPAARPPRRAQAP